MKRWILVAVMTLGVVALATAQQEPIAVLEYFDDDRELTIADRNGFAVNFYEGMGLSSGDQISTENTSVEIRLEPNGSIIRIGASTRFQLVDLEGRDGAGETRVRVASGRVRMVAARYEDRIARYSLETPSGVAGVRGTDFGVIVVLNEELPNRTPTEEATPTPLTSSEELFVFDGEVIFTETATERSVFVSGGQLVDLRTPDFLPTPMDQPTAQQRMQGLTFSKLDPQKVPGVAPQPEPERVTIDPLPAPEEEAPEPEKGEGFLDRFFGALARASGLQVGSTTINGDTYAQAVFQPRFSAGKLNAAFYLPVVYNQNLFDPLDWYQPQGNNEWSFSADQNWSREPDVAMRDLATDIALKIRYIEYGERQDPLFFKIGNLSTFTIGQGLLMRNYANDTDFPVVRRVGFNAGFDVTMWGMEMMVNDLTAPEIYGGRMFFRPAAPVIPAAVGISAITDLYPARTVSTRDRDEEPLPEETLAVLEATQNGEPIFLNVGVDLELPIIERERLGLTGFAEAGGLVPYLRSQTELNGQTVNSGLKTSALVDFSSGELKNFGWIAGFRGTFTILDFQLEYRSYDGIFRPTFYNGSYDRLRGTYATEMLTYLSDTGATEYKVQTVGVAGEASVSILELATISAGYFWPWERNDGGNWKGSSDDEFSVGLALKDGLIPFGITSGLEYRRTHFAATIAGWEQYDEAHLFDAYTTLDGYITYPVSPIIDLEARVSTAVLRDADGKVVYTRDGDPRITPVVVFQTKVGF